VANKIIPVDREILLPDNELIISKTDPQGNITYCNRAFMRTAGYSEKELLNAQHNIICHPYMPRGVYRHLWQMLEKGQEYFGYLKNMSNNGTYYWLFTHIVPDYGSNGELQGYYSVRRKARPNPIAKIEPIYKEMLAVEKQGDRHSGPELSVSHMHKRLKDFGTERGNRGGPRR
jgi:PAS domain S-box-containing protein